MNELSVGNQFNGMGKGTEALFLWEAKMNEWRLVVSEISEMFEVLQRASVSQDRLLIQTAADELSDKLFELRLLLIELDRKRMYREARLNNLAIEFNAGEDPELVEQIKEWADAQIELGRACPPELEEFHEAVMELQRECAA